MRFAHWLRKWLWRGGYDIVPFAPQSHPLARRRQLLRHGQIDTVLDVGANCGQFALELRRDLGYTGRIVSFEPLSAAFAQLQRNAHNDDNWQVFHTALGNENAEQVIHVAGNSYSSSLLAMLPSHEQAAPESRYVGTETVRVATLDTVFPSLCPPACRVYLKIDTQGFEHKVIQGALQSLPRIRLIQMELSLTPLYAGETLLLEMCAIMAGHGYQLIALEPGFADPVSGQLLQVDSVFQNSLDSAY